MLQELLDTQHNAEDLPDLLLQVVVTAYDPIYDADVCAVKVYGASDLALDSMYAGVMSTDEGEAMVNFDAIHERQASEGESVRTVAETPRHRGWTLPRSV